MEENTNKKSLNKTWLLVAGLVILTVILLVISLTSKVMSPNPSSTKEIKTDFAHTSLSVSDDVRTSSTADAYEVDVLINTEKDKVAGVQLELSFDPKVLSRLDIKPGTFFKDPVTIIKKIDTSTGRVTFAIANKPEEKPVTGTGVVATITFAKTGNAETAINFLPQTQVGSPGISQSVLRETSSAIIRVSSSAGSARIQTSPVLSQSPTQ